MKHFLRVDMPNELTNILPKYLIMFILPGPSGVFASTLRFRDFNGSKRSKSEPLATADGEEQSSYGSFADLVLSRRNKLDVASVIKTRLPKMLFQVCLYFYCKFLWRCLKFVMRKLTGRCELQRICYSTKPGASRTMKIETSLRDSKSKLLQTSVSVHPDAIEKTIEDIMELKKINPDINPQLGISLQACLLQIVGYRNLIADVEKLRREPYDSDNPQHEEMLLKLWKFLKPNTPLESRISKQWCEIGFQGDDPKTDFRGMGLLGLYNLQYFAERDAAAAQQVLSDSLHPKCSKFSKAEWEKKRMDKAIGYSFAIVGINITDLAYNLLVSGALKTHFYNIAPEAPTLSHFQQTFCYLMHEFHKFWIEEDPTDIMEFNRVREKFRKRIIKQLRNPDMALCPHFAASEGLINM